MSRRFNSLIWLLLLAAILFWQQPTAWTFAQQAPPAASGLSVVVLDPAHGGTDPGARGASGIVEKDVVLAFARSLAVQLERQGLRVVLTRQGDQTLSFDERAAIANAQRGAVFVSLHAGSTGVPGTARTYSFSGELETGGGGLLKWNSAQAPFLEQSKKLSELMQIQIGLKLRGSPEIPAAAALRQLRHVAAPAVAVEIASVSVADRTTLEAALPALAEAIVQGVASFRPLYSAVNF
ncbi:MAG TPA: N-acetylmuramoyl-L-alanine amidase [Candidatus Nitrosotenuis sp.]|nr:N-acetylmuramoyl-L-alanine amidase [Candidatus Nitrosotenuis sp.]